MTLMAVTCLVLLVGITLTLRWGGTSYQTWEPALDDGADRTPRASEDDLRPSVRTSALRYMRGVAIAVVGGFWAGALVTGPLVRLIMRLLAVTAGDDAQGRLTDADEVVGSIDLDGTVSLVVFGGILPGLLSGAIYIVCRRWLPSGRLGGIVFGALHLVVAATRIDPLRPDNPDFDLLGPGWLAVAAFGLASVWHGMAVVAIANRYSHNLPAVASNRGERTRAVLPLVLPTLLLIPAFFALIAIVVGLAVTIAASQIGPVVRFARSRGTLLAGRIAVVLLAVALLPGTIMDVHDVIVRDDDAAAPQVGQGTRGGGRVSRPPGHRSECWSRSPCSARSARSSARASSVAWAASVAALAAWSAPLAARAVCSASCRIVSSSCSQHAQSSRCTTVPSR
jgi:hypothetical protein